MALAMWRSFLAGNFKTSLIRRKPLLVPSLVFIITLIILVSSVPLPMSVYHGPNQITDSRSLSARFRVYEPGAYEADTQTRVRWSLASNAWIGVFANFSQEGVVVDSLFINMTQGALDEDNGMTRSISLNPGMYDVSIETMYYVDGTLQDQPYINIIVHQPIESAFIPEVTAWASYQFIIGVCCFFLFMGGICIGREEKTRWSREPIDQEPPREERYPSKFK